MTLAALHKKTGQPAAEQAVKRSLAALLKAAADPLRLDILRVLSRDSFGVQELARILSVPQPGMSHHLKILFKSGLVVTRRQGNSIFYRRSVLKGNRELDGFQEKLYDTVDSLPLNPAQSRRLSDVYKDRSLQSRLYFERHADKFEENQGMLCELPQYLPGIKELLDLMKLPKPSLAMEVGPGQGQLLQELARRFDKLVALDSSEEMLALTRQKLGTKGSGKIEFVSSSLESYDPKPCFDAVVLNMVMHHMSSPARAFQKLARLVSSQGYLLVADLCSHDQEWVKESCGDVWLGFDPGDLKDWAKRAGFEEEQSSYLGLKKGFQIQLKLFSRF